MRVLKARFTTGGSHLHIAMLSGEYPPRWGGMGSTVFHLSAALVRLGHRVTVITRVEPGAAKDPSIIPSQEGVSVRMVKWLKVPMGFTKSYGKAALKDLFSLHAEDPVDAVHVHAPMISWNAKQYAAVRSRIGNITTSLHGSWLGERDGLRRAAKYGEAAVWKNPNDIAILLTAGHYARYERAAVRGSTVCVANSEATKEDFEARYSPPTNWNCKVVRWGVDVDIFRPVKEADPADVESCRETRSKYLGDDESTAPLLLAVGRLAARKGFRTLLKSMPGILSVNPSAHLVIVGRGHMKRTLEKQANRLGVSNSVTIEPGMPFDDLACLFRSADLCVYPSYYEGQGLIPLEAMASGTPCATVDDGPLPEMVDSEVGGLFEVGNVESLSRVVNDLLSDKERLSQMASCGRERVLAEYTYDLNAARYADFYSE